MSDTADVQEYQVYYDNNSSMTNKAWISDCSTVIENPANTFAITCNNIELEDNQTYYFTIVALMNDNSELSSNPKEKTYILSPPAAVKNLRIVTPGEIIPSAFDLRIATISDNAEEINVRVTHDSYDLKLINDYNDQVIGMRFVNINIPRNSLITGAYLEFETDGTGRRTAESNNGESAEASLLYV